jgi:hypothetical protein
MSYSPTDALRREVEKANRKFGGAEVCHGCRRRLKSGEMNWVGRTSRKGGRVMVVANCCRGRLKVLVGFAIWYAMADAPAAWLNAIPPKGNA